MTKLLMGSALAALLGFGSPSYAGDKVLKVDGFEGGFEIFTAWGGYCIMAYYDIAPTYPYTTALAAKGNGWDITLYTAGGTGWGYGGYGSYTCTNAVVQ